MNKETLSAFPYYGGKSKMAEFICERLDYKNTDVYIEPYGGGARVLLNKPRHKLEIYSDLSMGLCAFFNIMSKEDTSRQLINKIYEEENYTQECFDRALRYRNRIDQDIVTQTYNELMEYQKKILIQYNIISKHANKIEVKKAIDKLNIDFKENKDIEKMELKYKLDKDSELNRLIHNYLLCYETQKEYGYVNIPDTWIETSISDMELALSTYIIYNQSRDGMGAYWSKEKFKTFEASDRRIDRLYEVADRLNGVKVIGSSLVAIFLKQDEYINNPKVMMYLDPSYLKEIDGKSQSKKYKNLGECYVASSDEEDHKILLKAIQNAKCKILISNYDVELYHQYLKPPRWKCEEYYTTTSVGGKKDNRRKEMIWYNY